MNPTRVRRKARKGSSQKSNRWTLLLPVLACSLLLLEPLGASGSEAGPVRPATGIKRKGAPKKVRVQAPAPAGNLQLEAERPLFVPPEAAAEIEAAKAAAKDEAIKAATGQAGTAISPEEAAKDRIIEKAVEAEQQSLEKASATEQKTGARVKTAVQAAENRKAAAEQTLQTTRQLAPAAASQAREKAAAAEQAAEAQLRVPEVEVPTPAVQLSVPGRPKVEIQTPAQAGKSATVQAPAAPQPGIAVQPRVPVQPGAAVQPAVPAAAGPAAGQPPAQPGELKAKTVTPEKSLFFIPVEKEAQVATPAQQENKLEKSNKEKDKSRGDVDEFQKSISKEYEGLSRDELVEIINNQLYRTSVVIQQLKEIKRRQSEEGASVSLGGSSPVDSRIKEAQALADRVSPSIYEAFPGDSPEAALERGNMLFRLGRYSLALQQYYVVRDHPDMKKDLDEAAQSWALFQVGNCEMLLGRLKSAQARWEEVNSYFEDKGAPPTAHIENKFRDFTEDRHAVLHWATGYWRRQAETELTQFKLKKDLQKANEASKTITASLQQRADTFIPKQPHLLLKKN